MNDFRVLKLSKTNCYLFSLDKGYLLLDSGYEHDKDLLIRRLNSAGVSIDQIRFLLLTHHHDDHSGLTNFLIQRNPELKVIMHESAIDLIQQGENHRAPHGGWCSPGTKFIAGLYRKINRKWTLSFPPYIVRDKDIIIRGEDDELIRSIGLEGRILLTPGHTEDSISLLDDQGNLFCGDSASNFLKWTGTKYTAPYISDLEQYYKSWEKIINGNAKRILPSHGKPFSLNKIQKNIHRITKLTRFDWD